MIHPSYWRGKNCRIETYGPQWVPQLRQFCEEIQDERVRWPAAENMKWPTLCEVLTTESRFVTGEFLLFFVNDQVAGVSGFHQSDIDPCTFVCGVRTYVKKEYRYFGVNSNFLLPYQLRESARRGARQCLIVFNAYNKRIFLGFPSLTRTLRERTEIDLEVVPLAEAIVYRNVLQHALLIKLDKTYSFAVERAYDGAV